MEILASTQNTTLVSDASFFDSTLMYSASQINETMLALLLTSKFFNIYTYLLGKEKQSQYKLTYWIYKH